MLQSRCSELATLYEAIEQLRARVLRSPLKPDLPDALLPSVVQANALAEGARFLGGPVSLRKLASREYANASGAIEFEEQWELMLRLVDGEYHSRYWVLTPNRFADPDVMVQETEAAEWAQAQAAVGIALRGWLESIAFRYLAIAGSSCPTNVTRSTDTAIRSTPAPDGFRELFTRDESGMAALYHIALRLFPKLETTCSVSELLLHVKGHCWLRHRMNAHMVDNSTPAQLAELLERDLAIDTSNRRKTDGQLSQSPPQQLVTAESLLVEFASAYASYAKRNIKLLVVSGCQIPPKLPGQVTGTGGMILYCIGGAAVKDGQKSFFLVSASSEDNPSQDAFCELSAKSGAWLLAAGRVQGGMLLSSPSELWCVAIYQHLSNRGESFGLFEGTQFWACNPFAVSIETLNDLETSQAKSTDHSEIAHEQAELATGANDVPLGERALLVLEALRDNKAFNSDSRLTTDVIAEKAAGPLADANQFKEVIADLKRRHFVHTKTGRGGGCWLTELGQVRAAKL